MATETQATCGRGPSRDALAFSTHDSSSGCSDRGCHLCAPSSHELLTLANGPDAQIHAVPPERGVGVKLDAGGGSQHLSLGQGADGSRALFGRRRRRFLGIGVGGR